VTVPDNSTTTFHARATTPAPGVSASDCSASSTRYEEMTPPAPPTPNIFQTPTPPTTRKKCKKHKHHPIAAKKKCKRKRHK
jgi:hypothetical protein